MNRWHRYTRMKRFGGLCSDILGSRQHEACILVQPPPAAPDGRMNLNLTSDLDFPNQVDCRHQFGIHHQNLHDVRLHPPCRGTQTHTGKSRLGICTMCMTPCRSEVHNHSRRSSSGTDWLHLVRSSVCGLDTLWVCFCTPAPVRMSLEELGHPMAM